MQKILILSTERDMSTTKVIRWITYLNPDVDVIRLHPEDMVNFPIHCHLASANFNIRTPFTEFNTSEIGAVWTRKWHRRVISLNSNSLSKQNVKIFENYLSDELDVFFQYFIFTIESNKKTYWLNKPYYVEPNKLIQLKVAQSVGLKTSESTITNTPFEIKHGNKYVSKPLSNCLSLKHKNNIYNNYTCMCVGNESQEDLFISYYQEYVSKEFEIRVFYLDGQCFAMAIHSQDNPKTMVDYRRYDYSNHNRLEPITLPAEISTKLIDLMNMLNLQTGSIDFILTKEGDYVFLEVNPCGQYDIFNTCNYSPDKLIAQLLISKINTQ